MMILELDRSLVGHIELLAMKFVITKSFDSTAKSGNYGARKK